MPSGMNRGRVIGARRRLGNSFLVTSCGKYGKYGKFSASFLGRRANSENSFAVIIPAPEPKRRKHSAHSAHSAAALRHRVRVGSLVHTTLVSVASNASCVFALASLTLFSSGSAAR